MEKIPKNRLVTAESVRAGHPDKFCDQLADRILDAHLKKDPRARIAVEVMATDGKLLIAGEVTSNAEVDYEQIARELIGQIGYDQSDLISGTGCEPEIEIRIHEQSPDISQAVGSDDEVGAGDQGIMVGYATDETPEYMPLPVVLAHRICRQMDVLMESHLWMGADGKAQVTVAYEEQKPVVIDTVIVSVQHHAHIERTEIEKVIGEMLKSVLPADFCDVDTKLLINPSGQFVLGGPAADTGLTGRKLAVDQYGPVARLGGGALSGKDPTKVDRSGAYAARWIARNIVAAGLARRCEVQLAYAIGRTEPVSIAVDAFGTGIADDAMIARAVEQVFDLRPAALTRDLQLRIPMYAPLAVYGHFGRNDLMPPWEKGNRSQQLAEAVLAHCDNKESRRERKCPK